jgi:DNA polymerase I-like protein with 3'-5' exonuclease and polymerase domains
LSKLSKPKLRIVNERPVYPAEENGANCSSCPLRGRDPIVPQGVGNAVVLLGESPGYREDESGKPFGGSNGYLLNQSLRRFGVPRAKTHLTYAVLCQPHEKITKEEWDQALKCCAPRLEGELNGDSNQFRSGDGVGGSGVPNVRVPNNPKTILACGSKALQALTGKAQITPWVGAPTVTKFGIVVPSIAIGFAVRTPAYIPVFQTFLLRALRISTGVDTLPYDWGKIVTEPPYAPWLKELLNSPLPLSVDIENAPIAKRIRCIGVGNNELAVSVPLPPEGFATKEELDLVRVLLKTSRIKVFQNGAFDRLELEKSRYVVSGPFEDTLLQHAVIAPRLPHNLGFMAACELPANRWKTEFHVSGEDKGKGVALKLFEKAPLEKLLPYNGRDVIAQARLYDNFTSRLKGVKHGPRLYSDIKALNEIGLNMSRFGIAVDRSKLDGHRIALSTELEKLRKRFREIVTPEEFTLGANGQHPSLARLFFTKFGSPVVSRSKETGAPSLDGNALVHYVGYFTTKRVPEIAEVARIVLQYRKLGKLLGTYIEGLPIEDDDRVYPEWRVFGTRTGRWSSTEPPMQTIPPPKYNEQKVLIAPGMRDLFWAGDGNVMVEADYSQLEVRMLAFLSGAPLLREWFAAGLDVHTMNARKIFNTPEPTKQQRTISKRVLFGLIYGGTAETLWKSLIVDFPSVKLDQIEFVVDGFYAQHSHVREYQNKLIAEAESNRYVEEGLSGRQQHYHDGRVSPTQVVNFPIQGGAGTRANWAIRDAAVHVDWKRTALVMQVHDALIMVGPNRDELVHALRGAMESPVTHNGETIVFPTDVKCGTNWGHMEEVGR